jgi:hypothetical protein
MRTFSPDVDLDGASMDPLRTSQTGSIQLTEIYSLNDPMY